MNDERVVEAINTALLRQGMSQAALAVELSRYLQRPFDRSMVNKMVQNRRKISAVEMAAITAILDDPDLNDLARPAGLLFEGLSESGVRARISENGDGPLVPVYDVWASAGHGAAVEYEPQTTSLAFPPEYLAKLTSSNPRNLAIISVKGDSMEPTLLDDDIVLLDRSKTNLSFDGLFVLRFDDALHVKRIGRAPQPGHITIISDNRSFPAIVAKRDDIEAVGKVLWYGRRV